MDRINIVFGRNVGNTLGQIRSLGEAGYNPILVWVGDESTVLSNSKYIKEQHVFKTIKEGIDFIYNRWGGEY